jgi:uncharacterized protein YpbB
MPHVGRCPTQHHNKIFPSPSTRDISTNMAPIDDAITAIESLEPGEHFTYRGIADVHGIQHSTLRHHHIRQTQLHAGAALKRQKLSPQQEQQLVQYIEDLTEQELPPTRAMIQNFGGDIAGEPCADTWVS